MTIRSSRHVVRVVAMLPLLLGCYRYAPIELGSAAVGAGVRARVTPSASERIAPLLGVSSARELTGTLVARSGDTLIVEVPAPGVADPNVYGRVLNQRVSIPRSDLVELETRTLDRMRTGAVVGASAAVLVSVLVKVLQGNPASDKTPGGGGAESLVPAASRVP